MYAVTVKYVVTTVSTFAHAGCLASRPKTSNVIAIRGEQHHDRAVERRTLLEDVLKRRGHPVGVLALAEVAPFDVEPFEQVVGAHPEVPHIEDESERGDRAGRQERGDPAPALGLLPRRDGAGEREREAAGLRCCRERGDGRCPQPVLVCQQQDRAGDEREQQRIGVRPAEDDGAREEAEHEHRRTASAAGPASRAATYHTSTAATAPAIVDTTTHAANALPGRTAFAARLTIGYSGKNA